MNKCSNYMKHALVIVWCVGILLLGGCSDTEESTWKQEYEIGSDTKESTWKQEYEVCMATMKLDILEYGVTGKQELSHYQKEVWDEEIALWQDSFRAFKECVETCIRNQPGGMDGEENIYRTATLLMAAMYEEYNGSYTFVHEHGDDTEKELEDFRAAIEGENPIDESRSLFHEDFGIYNYADALISEMMSEAWQEEFHHCLNILRSEVKQSGDADKEQILEVLEAYEDFFEVWKDNECSYKWLEYYKGVGIDHEERYEWMEPGRGGICIWQAESSAEIFRIGTMLLIDGLEKSGGSYGFIYNSEAGRQELVDLLGVCPDTDDGTWKQEYEICMVAMELGISEYGMTGEQELSRYQKEARDKEIALWQDSFRAFKECVETCIRNQPGGMDGEENIYRTATLLMAATCEKYNGSYTFVHEHGDDTEKELADFRAAIEGENPIDESRSLFHEDFGIYNYADAHISEMMSEAWQEEFHHCLNMVENEVKQSGDTDKEQILEILEAYEDFFEVWEDNECSYKWLEYYNGVGIDHEERYEWREPGRGGIRIWQAESSAEIFRIGTMLLIDGLEESGGSYGFVYNKEASRQELIDLLGVCPDTDDGTWKQEYEICMAAMELGISRYDITGANVPYENLPRSEQYASDKSMELWRDSLRAFDECVKTCVRNQTGGMDGEEDTYRMAVLLMKVMCERRNGHYTLAHEHDEDTEKALENFKAIIGRENPIDKNIVLFYESFGSYYYADTFICEMMSEAWQEEFYHCLDRVRSEVKQSDAADQEQILETLEAWEAFHEVWADNEEEYERIESGTGLLSFIAESRAEVFRIGTMLLIDGLEKSGGSYEFIYDSEADRQELINAYAEYL